MIFQEKKRTFNDISLGDFAVLIYFPIDGFETNCVLLTALISAKGNNGTLIQNYTVTQIDFFELSKDNFSCFSYSFS